MSCDGDVASAVVDSDVVDAVAVQHTKAGVSWGWVGAAHTRVVKLYAQSYVFEGSFHEMRARPPFHVVKGMGAVAADTAVLANEVGEEAV